MNILYVLVPVAIVLASAGVAAFLWAVRSGQFDDVQTPAIRLLLEEEQGRITPDSPPARPADGDKSTS